MCVQSRLSTRGDGTCSACAAYASVFMVYHLCMFFCVLGESLLCLRALLSMLEGLVLSGQGVGHVEAAGAEGLQTLCLMR